LQLYFIGDEERELDLRSNVAGDDIDKGLLKSMQRTLHECNKYIKELKTTIERIPPSVDEFKVIFLLCFWSVGI